MFKRNSYLLPRIIVSLALVAWLVHSIKFAKIVGSLKTVDLWWLFAAIMLVVASMAVSVIKWNCILMVQGFRLNFKVLWKIYWEGLFFNNFFPSSIGGDGLRIYRMTKLTGDAAGAASSVFIERIIGTLALGLVGLTGLLGVEFIDYRVVLILVAIILLSLFLLYLFVYSKTTNFIAKRENKVTTFIKQFVDWSKKLKINSGGFLQVLLWSLVFQMINIAVNFCIFKGLNLHQLTWMDLCFIIPATIAAAMFPIGINGYGIREGCYILFLTPYGVEYATAFSASLLYALVVSACSLWGGVIWLSRKGSSRFKQRGSTRETGLSDG